MSLLKFENLMNKSDKTFAENVLLKFGFFILLICTIINSVTIQRIENQRETHIIPVGTGLTYEFTNGKANDIYLMKMARFIIDLRGNITAANVDENFGMLLTLYSEDKYGDARDFYKKVAEEIKRYSSVSYQVIINANTPLKKVDNRTLYVDAVKRQIVGNSITSKTPLKFKIVYQIRDGRFEILELKELKP